MTVLLDRGRHFFHFIGPLHFEMRVVGPEYAISV